MKLMGAIITTILFIVITNIVIWGYTDDTYRGEVAFSTNAEYVDFKEFIALDSVALKDSRTLSSDPPIIVAFELSLPHGDNSPYGELYNDYKITDTFLGIIICALVSILLWHAIPEMLGLKKQSGAKE